jgi:hypothetical protein
MGIIERVVSGSGVALNEGHVIPLLIAVAVDDHLAIRFPVALLDDRCFAWLALALLDYGRSFAISVAVIRAYRHSGSNRTNSDTNTDFFRACRYCRAYACCRNYCQYVLHESLLALCCTHGLNPMHQLSFRPDRSVDTIAPDG